MTGGQSFHFLWHPGIPGVPSMGPDLTFGLTNVVQTFTDVTLADEDTISIPTDNAKWAIQENVAMQSGCQLWN